MGKPYPNLTSLRFDTTGFTLHTTAATDRSWYSPERAAVTVRFFSQRAEEWMNPKNFEMAYENYERECTGNKGVILDFCVTEIDTLPAISGVFKYRSPHNHRAAYIVGIIMIPRDRYYFQIHVESAELGTTGMREAVVMTTDPVAAKHWPGAEREPVVIESAEQIQQMENELAASPATQFPSDDVRFDEMFPHHPLSKVRKVMAYLQQSIQLEQPVHSSMPM